MNLRVVVSGNSGDGFSYRIEDVREELDPNVRLHIGGADVGAYPFVQRLGGLTSAPSVEDLRKQLRAALAACDKPLLYLTAPRLEEWR